MEQQVKCGAFVLIVAAFSCGADMSKAPPDGWSLITGTWETDADQNTTTFLSGFCSVELKATATATKLASELMPITQGTYENKHYEVAATFRATRANIGDTILIQAKIYNSDYTLQSTTTIYNDTVDVIGDWYTRSATIVATNATDNFVQIEVSKAAAAFAVYLDSVEVAPSPPFFAVLRDDATADFTVASSAVSWTSVDTFDAPASAAYSDVLHDSGNIAFLYTRPGTLRAQVTWVDSIPDGTVIGIRIVRDGTQIATTKFAVGAAGTHQIEVTYVGLINAYRATTKATNYLYAVEVIQNSGTDKDATVHFQGYQTGF
jgi:hypothetical protein